jgi:hypothetical protein
MLHMLATLVSLFVLFGAGSIIAASLVERMDAIESALGFSARPRTIHAARRHARVRWYNVRTISAGLPMQVRSAA